MKAKHNKKRNTAFVFEALAREATVSIIKGDKERQQKIVDIVRKHFQPDSFLRKDLECYRSLYENQELENNVSRQVIEAAKAVKKSINSEGLFEQQTELIKDINKTLSPKVFSNFVPNYKTLATIAKMFNTSSPKEGVLLENKIVDNMSKSSIQENMKPIDNIVYSTFVKRFNEKYADDLLEEQKELLTYYITSFADNALELKIYMNEEVARLKNQLQEAKKTEEIKNDSEMIEKTDKVMQKLLSYEKLQEPANEQALLTVLKTQQLVKEIYEDGSNN